MIVRWATQLVMACQTRNVFWRPQKLVSVHRTVSGPLHVNNHRKQKNQTSICTAHFSCMGIPVQFKTHFHIQLTHCYYEYIAHSESVAYGLRLSLQLHCLKGQLFYLLAKVFEPCSSSELKSYESTDTLAFQSSCCFPHFSNLEVSFVLSSLCS
jgi:hypothetical protein